MNSSTNVMDTPIYDAVRSDLSIEPEEQMGHDARVGAILHDGRSQLL